MANAAGVDPMLDLDDGPGLDAVCEKMTEDPTICIYPGCDRIAGAKFEQNVANDLIKGFIPKAGMLRQSPVYRPKLLSIVPPTPVKDARLQQLQARVHSIPSLLGDALDWLAQVNTQGNRLGTFIHPGLWDLKDPECRLKLVREITDSRMSWLLNPIQELKQALGMEANDDHVFGDYQATKFTPVPPSEHPPWAVQVGRVWWNEMVKKKRTRFPDAQVPSALELQELLCKLFAEMWKSPQQQRVRNAQYQKKARGLKRAREEEIKEACEKVRKQMQQDYDAFRQSQAEALGAARQEARAAELASQALEETHKRNIEALRAEYNDAVTTRMTQFFGNSIFYATHPSQQPPTQQQMVPRFHPYDHMPYPQAPGQQTEMPFAFHQPPPS